MIGGIYHVQALSSVLHCCDARPAPASIKYMQRASCPASDVPSASIVPSQCYLRQASCPAIGTHVASTVAQPCKHICGEHFAQPAAPIACPVPPPLLIAILMPAPLFVQFVQLLYGWRCSQNYVFFQAASSNHFAGQTHCSLGLGRVPRLVQRVAAWHAVVLA